MNLWYLGEIVDRSTRSLVILVSQLKTYKVKLKEESCIRVNIRELNEVPSTKLSTLYMLDC